MTKSLIVLTFAAIPLLAQLGSDPLTPLREGLDRKEAVKITDNIYQAIGFGNTFLVTTPAGNVIIDTSNVLAAPLHVKLLKARSAAPVKYIILTHGHGDHTGGVGLWKEPGTQVIAQRNQVEFLNYQERLNRFFALRNSAQFVYPTPPAMKWPGDEGAKRLANILFDDKYEFTLGGVKFEIFSTPGETLDHLSVWIPQWRAAFTGDNFYASFPNIYTLRGTEPRMALDYVHSLDKVISWKPEILLPSHGPAMTGEQTIAANVGKYRDAILYVHDAVVKGMNDGKDAFTLMREIKLPENLNVGEGYGKLTWSIRGIYEGYAGWFDLNPATMYEAPPSSPYADLVKLAGGPDPVVARALQVFHDGQAAEALRLIDAALAADAAHRGALEARLRILKSLSDQSKNSNERGWLEYSIRETRAKLAAN
jgi:alkyl sulfatase BDS1-like metallo-beta-lactamase superfamily hydrolase